MQVRDQTLDFVSEYKHLGVLLDELLSFQKALILRTDQANKAFWSLCSQQRKVGELPATGYKKLYDSLVPWWHPCLTMELQYGHSAAR